MSAQPDDGEVNVTTPIGTLRARGTDIISLLGFTGIVAMTTILWMHMEDAKKSNVEVAATNKEVAAALKEANTEFAKQLSEVVKAHRFSTCILATDQEKREKEYMKPDSYCNRTK